MKFPDLQTDKLKQSFKDGANEALHTLSGLMSVEPDSIKLTDQVLTSGTINDVIKDHNLDENDLNYTQIQFDDPNYGLLFQICSKRDSQKLVRLLTGEALEGAEYLAAETDVLMEVGNVVLNSCVVQICNDLNIKITTNIPELKHIDPEQMIKDIQETSLENEVLYMEISFSIEKDHFHGRVGLLLAHKFFKAINE